MNVSLFVWVVAHLGAVCLKVKVYDLYWPGPGFFANYSAIRFLILDLHVKPFFVWLFSSIKLWKLYPAGPGVC